MEVTARTGARIRRGLALLAMLGCLPAIWHLVVGGGPTWRAIVLPGMGFVVQLGALAACLARIRLVARDRGAWRWLAAAVLLWLAGWVVASVQYALTGPAGGPAPADALYIAFYPCAYVGLFLLARGRALGFRPSLWLDGLIAGCAVGAVGACLIIEPLRLLLGGELATVAVGLAYPLGDLLLLALIGGVLALTGWRPDREWACIGAGLVIFAVADSAYVVLAAQGSAPTVLLGLLWVASVLLLAAGAWAPRPETAPSLRLDGWRVLLVPLVFAAVAVGLLAYGQATPLPVAGAALATATLVLVMGRTALTFRENLKLIDARRLALTDELTGLANRRRLIARMDTLLAQGDGPRAPVALLLVDLDRFKELNDALGHHIGDLLLTRLSARLEATLPDADVIARLGGDEFAVLLRGHDAGAGAAADAAARLLGSLETPFALEGLELCVQASVGGALHPEHADDAAGLLQRADVAMYAAKRDRAGYALYRPERDLHSRTRLALTHDLRGAIAAGELVLHYQPKAEVGSGEVVGVEALVRWAHPEHGLLTPDVFLPLAEESGLMRPLTLRVLRDALGQLADWDARGLRLGMAVNLALANLVDPLLPEDVDRLLRERGLPPERLVLEVTEDLVLTEATQVIAVLDRLHRVGVGLALDDFGAGRSSLAHLSRLPLDELKLDRSFVRRMAEDPREATIVGAVVQLARSLGLRVVAEGVEDAERWDELARLGVHAAQGFHLARPLAPAVLEAWLAERAVAATLASAAPAALTVDARP